MRDPDFVYLGPKPLPGAHVADGIVPLAPSPGQHPAEVQAQVLSDLSALGRLLVRILAFIGVPFAVLLLIAAALSGCGSPAPRPTPRPDLPARADVLAVALALPAELDELDARLRWGAGRVEFWRGVSFSTGPAIALGLYDAPSPTSEGSTRAAEVGRTRSASAAVAGRTLETTRNGRRGARFEAVGSSVSAFTVVSGPGAAEVSRRALLGGGAP